MRNRPMATKVCDKWDLLLTVCFALFVYFWHGFSDDLILRILGGVPDYGGKVIPYIPFGRWLFLFGFFLFSVCRSLYEEGGINVLERYRYKEMGKWWRKHFLMLHLKNTVLFLICYAIWYALERKELHLMAAVTFFLHLSMMISVLLLADYLDIKIMPCLLIVAEGMGYVLSVNYDLPSLANGMYNRSIFVRKDGFSFPVYLMEIIVIGICYVAVPFLWKRNIRERKEL